MMRYLRKSSPIHIASIVATMTLSGCGGVSEETVTLLPIRTASILATASHNFGICHAGIFRFIERRPPTHFLWREFLRDRGSRYTPPAYLTGYEVLIDRGESCHLATANRYQTAVAFDLSGLPSTAVVSARLRITQEVFYGTDPPVDNGPAEEHARRCTVLIVGQATETWESGIFPTGEEGSFSRDFVASRPVRPDPGPYRTVAPVDVTRAVSEWARGTQPNHGFVIAPDREAVASVAASIREGGVLCPVWMLDFSLDVTVATPD